MSRSEFLPSLCAYPPYGVAEASPPPRAAVVKDLPRSGAAQAASLTDASTAAGSDKEGNCESRVMLVVATSADRPCVPIPACFAQDLEVSKIYCDLRRGFDLRVHFLAVIGIVSSILMGCTPSDVVPVAGLPPSAKSVVIVPSLPRYLIVATSGITPIGDALDTPPISDWHLDQLVYNAAVRALSKTYSVSEAEPKDVLVDYQSRLSADVDNDDGVAELVKTQISVSPAPDLYVVFCVSARSNPNVSTASNPEFLQDIGVSGGFAPWGSLTPIIHTFVEMTVIDGKTMKVIYDSPLIMPPGSNSTNGFLISRNDPFPEKKLLGFSEWHTKWVDMTPSQQQAVKFGIENMLSQAVAYTVGTAMISQ